MFSTLSNLNIRGVIKCIFLFIRLKVVYIYAKRNKTGFILYAPDSPPLNSRVENKTSFKFLFYVWVDSAN